MAWSQQDSLYGARHLASKWAYTPDPNAQGRGNYLQNIVSAFAPTEAGESGVFKLLRRRFLSQP